MADIVIGVDPGGTTGLATWESTSKDVTVQQMHWEEASDWLWDTLEHQRVRTTVVCERYTINRQTLRKSRQYEALYVIGGLILLCRRFHSKLELQTSADAKGFCTDKRLRERGWYAEGLEHGRDATRHLLLYLVKNQLVSPV